MSFSAVCATTSPYDVRKTTKNFFFLPDSRLCGCYGPFLGHIHFSLPSLFLMYYILILWLSVSFPPSLSLSLSLSFFFFFFFLEKLLSGIMPNCFRLNSNILLCPVGFCFCFEAIEFQSSLSIFVKKKKNYKNKYNLHVLSRNLMVRALRSSRTIEQYVLLSLRTIEKRKDWIWINLPKLNLYLNF